MDQQYKQYLQIVSIFHYVVGGIVALIGCFPLLHLFAGILTLAFGLALPTLPETSPGDVPLPFLAMPALIGIFFILIAGSMILFFWTFAVLEIITGVFLAKRTHYLFCLIMAGIECTFKPFGTVLGVFTIILLLQPAVKEMFGILQPPIPPTPPTPPTPPLPAAS
jgi:hypothetical protein